MSEPDPENPSDRPKPPYTAAMDLDSDLDSDTSWPLDQLSFGYNPMSPFLLSSSEQPGSPVWFFSDAVDNDRSAGNFPAGRILLSDCNRFVTHNPESETENPTRNEDKMGTFAPPTGLTLVENPDGSRVMKERMTQALRYLIQSEQNVLAQIWAPVKTGGRYVLTTSGQPFVLDPQSNGLHQYRMASVSYMFSLDGESDGELGLPGRVFRQKMPEWSPNVQYYTRKEYPRLKHALHYNVQGSLALPVFDPYAQSCVGVLEIIMTSPKINYAPEVDKVCKALEAVNLKSSEILDHSTTQFRNVGRQNALAEILEILTIVCENHKLPLAQTWVPCRHRNILAYGGGLNKSCTSFDGSCMGQVCMSTTDVAFYIVDSHMWGFREACAEHHLQKGQGVAGRAFSSHDLCFCRDITQFCKIEYPLVHYARMFGLTSCFAICFRSSHTGDDDYVLELFLPPGITDNVEQQSLLDSILDTMRQHFQSLKVASGKVLEEDRSVEVITLSADDIVVSSLESIPHGPDISGNKGEVARPESPGKQLVLRLDDDNPASFPQKKEPEKKRTSERKRGKAEKSISLEVLQQYFAGSLKDAAKSLGVCPTTMKRICRQHGISRWPSRKIKKVNRSLTKLQRVIESVQGAEGTFGPLPTKVGSIPWAASFDGPNQQTLPFTNKHQPEKNGSPQCSDEKTQFDDHQLLEPSGFVLESGKGSRDESGGTRTPTSHGSCQGSPEITPANEPCISLALSFQQLIPDPLVVTPVSQNPLGGMLLGDAGSAKDLKILCPVEEAVAITPPFTARQDIAKTLTIKATYRDDIIRFKFSLSSSIVDLKEEVAKRFKLEVGTFDMKYLDDDHEWVLVACDADLVECMDISKTSGGNAIRLLVHEVMAKLGSSSESTGT